MGALALAAGGCSIVPEPKADPTRHYVLTAPAQASAEAPKDKAVAGLHNVEMPAYLRTRKTIAVRRDRNEIVYEEYARWAEALEDGIERIVSERLLASGTFSAVSLLPGGAARTCDLTIRVLECEGAITSEGASARFAAEYEITTPNGRAISGTRRFIAPAAAWDGKDYAALANLLGNAATTLADDIAKNMPEK